MSEPAEQRDQLEENPIRAILVATDFSDTARAGEDWAAEIASWSGAAIRLVHGLLLPNRMTDYVPSPPDLTEALETAALARLEDAAARLRRRGVAVETELRIGLPSEAILEAAREGDPDLLVIGTRGLSGITHLLLGSTAERVVQHAPCPVLTVHPGDLDRHREIRTILVSTDFSADAGRAIPAARALLRGGDEARLVLLHVYHLPVEYTAYGSIPTSLNYLEDAGAVAQEEIDRLAGELREQGVRVEGLAREGYPPEVIVTVAEELGADLVALGTHGRSGLAHLLLGSTAERVVQKAPCPVLTVRRREG